MKYTKLPFILTALTVFLCLVGTVFAADKPLKRTVEEYSVPDVTLVNQDGKKIHLKEYLQSGKPVIVDFIFGTCTTICPILSASFTDLQQKLGQDAGKVQLVSISIDPENDSPKVMKEYLKRYHAKPGWDFLSGNRADIDKVMRAFNAYIPNKMSHFPLTLIRPTGDTKWVRIFGLMNSSEFIKEVRKAGVQ